MEFTDKDKEILIQFLGTIDSEICSILSDNMAISLYDILCEPCLDEERLEFKIAEFFAGMPDELKLLHHALGSISLVRLEILMGKDKIRAQKVEQVMVDYFTRRSRELNEGHR